MYKKILLAYDGSPQSDAALRQSVSLARLCDAKLHLLGVVSLDLAAAYPPQIGVPNFFALKQGEVEEALMKATSDLKKQGMHVSTKLREGNAAQEIAGYATELDADLAVIGHTDKGALARFFEGSTGAELVRHLPCNLLIVADG